VKVSSDLLTFFILNVTLFLYNTECHSTFVDEEEEGVADLPERRQDCLQDSLHVLKLVEDTHDPEDSNQPQHVETCSPCARQHVRRVVHLRWDENGKVRACCLQDPHVMNCLGHGSRARVLADGGVKRMVPKY
jgi:hypothetical protein